MESYLKDRLQGEVHTAFEQHLIDGKGVGSHAATELSPGVLKHVFTFADAAPFSTAAHEAMHGFLAELKQHPAGQELRRVLTQVANSKPVRAQLERFLANEPAALKAMRADSDEAIAHMFEAWSGGQLKLGEKGTTWLGKLRDFLHRVTGIWTKEQRAGEIMRYFDDGQFRQARNEPSAVARALVESGNGKPYIAKAWNTAKPIAQAVHDFTVTIPGKLHETGIPALQKLAAEFKTDVNNERGARSGFLEAATQARSRALNTLGEALHGLSEAQVAQLPAHLDGSRLSPEQDVQVAAEKVRAWLDSLHGEGRRLGLFAGTPHAENPRPMRQLADGSLDTTDERGGTRYKKNYWPQLWDDDKVGQNRDKFIALLQKHNVSKGDAEHAADAIIGGYRNGVGAHDEITAVGWGNTRVRALPDIPYAELKEFTSSDPVGTLVRYASSATRKIEFTRRFEKDGGVLQRYLDAAKEQGANENELAYARSAVDGMLGLKQTSEGWKNFNGVAMGIANVALLGLSWFGSVMDPATVGLRSGDWGDAVNAAKHGFGEMRHWMKDSPTYTADQRMAMDLGIIESSAVHELMTHSYDLNSARGVAKRASDLLFRYNLQDGWAKSMRVAALQSGIKFVEKHMLDPHEHSERYMQELNLDKSQLTFKDGRLVVDPHNAQLAAALNHYVDSVVLRPTQAERPLWATDPRWQFAWHLKSFSYAFQRNFLARAAHEFEHGNKKPLGFLAASIPIALAAGVTRTLLTHGGHLTKQMDGFNAIDWLQYGAQRAGLNGATAVWQPVLEGDVAYAAGPTVELIKQALTGGDGHETGPVLDD